MCRKILLNSSANIISYFLANLHCADLTKINIGSSMYKLLCVDTMLSRQSVTGYGLTLCPTRLRVSKLRPPRGAELWCWGS